MGKAFLFGIGGSSGGSSIQIQTKTVELSMTTGNQTISPDEGYALSQVTVQKPSTLIPDNIKSGIVIGGVTGSYAGGGVTLPTLKTPSISRNGGILNISNPSTNGSFVTGYKIYANGVLVNTQTSTSFNLNSLDPGTYSITVAAYGSNFNDSNQSNSLSYSVWSITNVLTDLTTSNTATKVGMNMTYNTVFTPATNMYLPSEITVTMGGEEVTVEYDNNTGTLSIDEVTGNVVITAVAATTPKLAATTISLNGTIVSWLSVENAMRYSVRANDIQITNTTELSCDLSTLLSEDGSYTITVVAQADDSRDSNPSNSVIYNIGIQPIYGVSGLYQSTPALTRTDDAVGKTFTINSSSGTIVSDFDDLFPWNAATLETVDGNEFIHMPDMWFRIGTDANDYITDIAVSAQQGPTGNWYKVNSFYYSRYGGSTSNGKLVSVSGATRTHTQTRAQFRALAMANGDGYFQEDLYHKTVMNFLWWIEWATKDSASIMTGRTAGSGTSGGNSIRSTGGTDTLITPSGFEIAYKQMRWHYIEDFVGNLLEFVDGSVGAGSSGGIQYVSAIPANYSDSTSGMNASFNSPTSSGNCIVAFGWDANNPFLCLPKLTVSNNSYNTYFCDYGSTSNNVVLCCGARWNYSSANYGVSYFDRRSASYSIDSIGGRLLKQ